jgi:hypothetical protein
MRLVEFDVSGSDSSSVNLLASLRKSQINLVPVVDKTSRVDLVVLHLQRRLVETIVCLMLKLSRGSFAKRGTVNIKKQEIALSLGCPIQRVSPTCRSLNATSIHRYIEN